MDIINFLNEEKQYYLNVVYQLEKSIEQSNEQDRGALNYFRHRLEEVKTTDGIINTESND